MVSCQNFQCKAYAESHESQPGNTLLNLTVPSMGTEVLLADVQTLHAKMLIGNEENEFGFPDMHGKQIHYVLNVWYAVHWTSLVLKARGGTGFAGGIGK